MPEIKKQFTKGKMNKDLDERLVPEGEYRDAMNIQVSTSEEGNVGTVQNILGNAKIPFVNPKTGNIYEFPNDSIVVAAIADEKNDKLYWFIHSQQADFIVSLSKIGMSFVFIDTTGEVLKFGGLGYKKITGINIIDGMIFWTDNKSEPKKINIKRSEFGTFFPSTTGVLSNTKLVVDQNPPLENYLIVTTPTGVAIDVEEEHITVIKKTPKRPPSMDLVSIRDNNKIYTGIIYIEIDDGGFNGSSFNFTGGPTTQSSTYNFAGIDVFDDNNNTLWMQITDGIDVTGTEVSLSSIGDINGWGNNPGSWTGLSIVFKEYSNPLDWNDPPGIPVTDHTLKGVIKSVDTTTNSIEVEFNSMEGSPPLPDTAAGQAQLKYAVDLFDTEEKLFEFKFPRFSYRYKYEDGEYSPFAPFTDVAFSPGAFDYHPRKGYNIGMTNKLKQVNLGKFITEEMDKDIISVDILFKDDASSVVYVVDTLTPFDDIGSSAKNKWKSILEDGDTYAISAETVNQTVESNQLLRPWDNVPRKALAQDITGNRIVYANYIQNFNLNTVDGDRYFADFKPDWKQFPQVASDSNKSIKSLREYQLGVVFLDEYGRETPVISNSTGTLKLEKKDASKRNRIKAGLKGDKFPVEAKYLKWFIKETANEYYNMAMDRWYYAEDGNVWLSFPSSDRNKIDIDTFLILKKGSDSDALVEDAARYKVLAIEAEAPDFIKTEKHLASREVNIFASGNVLPNEIWEENTIDNIPLVGSKTFTLKWDVYKNNPGRNLHEYTDGELWIEFGLQGEEELSNRYRISTISLDEDDDIYYVQTEEPFEEDINFITLGGGVSPTGIKSGTIVNIYKYVKRNAPQFDGKFFVKIYFNDIFRKNIQKTYEEGAKYRIVDSNPVYMLKRNFIEQFTRDMSWWFTPGRWHNPDDGFGVQVIIVQLILLENYKEQ